MRLSVAPWGTVDAGSAAAIFQRLVEGGAPVAPDDLKTALRLHQRANPAVLILVRCGADGRRRLVHDIPMGVGSGQAARAGDILRAD